ncbi:type II toxin-antitoxin system HicB family antitoxin [Neptunomonas japonica]|uniref:HicB family protein n=1 Tax=Neptunomonas japonica JAMM 1380 TaxID=1441457 RepID=A0A7R6PMY2_9GAMM|nr:type II toxin-antitoxin system HicB family antitoxin [Neptunomonas japonica]BBB29352.1 HicB family protein [Neptunomonas japonica JAMM 1380]
MNTTKKHKGYIGTMEIDCEDNILCGKILYIQDLIMFEADDPKGLQKAFEEAVDDYLATCEEIDKKPDQPLSGTTNIRIGQERHRAVAIKAHQDGISINQLLINAVDFLLEDKSVTNNIHLHVQENASAKEKRNTIDVDYNDLGNPFIDQFNGELSGNTKTTH